MEVTHALLLAGAISLADSYDNSDERAIRALALYSYRQTGLERDVKRYTKKMLPDEFRKYSGLIIAVYTVVDKQRIEFRWTF